MIKTWHYLFALFLLVKEIHCHFRLLLHSDLGLYQNINVNFSFLVPAEILFIDPLVETLKCNLGNTSR